MRVCPAMESCGIHEMNTSNLWIDLVIKIFFAEFLVSNIMYEAGFDAWEEMIDRSILQKVVSYSNANRSNNTLEITIDDLKKSLLFSMLVVYAAETDSKILFTRALIH